MSSFILPRPVPLRQRALSMGNAPIQKAVALPPRPFERYAMPRRKKSRRHYNKPSIMLQLIARRDWQKVLIRASIAPAELSQKQILCWYGVDVKVLPIHLACALDPPPQVIEKLLYFHADTANVTMTKSRIAKPKKKRMFRRSQSENFIIPESNTDPTTVSEVSFAEEIPAGLSASSLEHFLESRGMVLQLGVTGNLQPVAVNKPKAMVWDLKPLLREADCLLPIHVACLYQASSGVLSHLLEANPNSAKVAAWGMLPIHMLCANFSIPPPIAAPVEFIQLPSEYKLVDCLRTLIQYYPESVQAKSFQNGMTTQDYVEETMDDGRDKSLCLRLLGGECLEEEYNIDGQPRYTTEELPSASFDTTDTLSTNSEGDFAQEVPSEIHCNDENLPPFHVDFEEGNEMKWEVHNPLYELIQSQEWEEAYYLLQDDPELAHGWQYGIELDGTGEPQLWKRLPIHNACRYGAPIALLVFLLRLNPDFTADPYTGSLPIHLACRYSPYPETIQLLLSHDPSCAKKENNTKQLPMHLACISGSSKTVIQMLLKSYPAAVICKDKDGKTPLDHDYNSLDDEMSKVMKRLQQFWARVEKRKDEEEQRLSETTEKVSCKESPASS
eukprot:CAMPEP_0178925682 /NCGR_PEP_ID=MMETSP0786-20121207/18058_1 /TAXON_ID=186022 /ORGANISM="Thalassionema frauenfeldii, Strain CCMP 1798" /LENGTH=612 /DNA_ID=CAMNT_0020600611 /DNA_START=249 /DNA_END=2090 /DNA_ORIENTATION=-